jgi:hypothetical protein
MLADADDDAGVVLLLLVWRCCRQCWHDTQLATLAVLAV